MSSSVKSSVESDTLSVIKQQLLKKWTEGKYQSSGITRREVPLDSAPLSFAQQRLWFIEQLVPGAATNNIPGAVKFIGRLDVEALEISIHTLVQRHESLRTAILSIDGKPIQKILPELSIKLEMIDIRKIATNKQKQQVDILADEEARKLFDLTKGQMLRAKLIQLAEHENVLLITMHHIASDGWSMGIFVKEIASLYSTFFYNKSHTLPELPIQYADFAVWQREHLTESIIEKQLTYWRSRLSGDIPPLKLNANQNRPNVPSYQGATCVFELSQSLTDSLNQYASTQGATLFMMLLAAFKTLLFRYSQQTDLCVGSPIANRNRTEIEGLIGFFVNTLVLRTEVNADLTFSEVLARVRETTLEAYSHQDIPFEKLVEDLNPRRSMSHSPFFQLAFVLHNAPMPDVELPELTIAPMTVHSRTSKYDLLLAMEENEQHLKGTIEYNTDMYDEDFVGQLMSHFQTLLHEIVERPELKISQLSLLAPVESLKLLDQWQQRQAHFEPEHCIHHLFERTVRQYPNSTALKCPSAALYPANQPYMPAPFSAEQLTYDQLNKVANQLAHHLISLGAGREEVIGIYMDHSLETIVSILAILKSGSVYLPMTPAFPSERLRYMLDDTKVNIVITRKHLKGDLVGIESPKASRQIVCLDSDWQKIRLNNETSPKTDCRPENIAYIIYTSGSTGIPKGVQVSHYNVVRLFQSTDSLFNFNQQDVWTFFHSSTFDFSVWELWGSLFYGGRLIVIPFWLSRSTKIFYQLLRQEKVTVLNLTPSSFQPIIKLDQQQQVAPDLNLRLVIFGGEALDLQKLEPWFERHGDKTPQLVNMYGITETTVHVTYHLLTRDDLVHGSASIIGKPLPDLSLYLLDRHMKPVPSGIVGEIYIAGAGVSQGYLNRQTLTDDCFVIAPFNSSERLYKTGDLGRYRTNGEIEYAGRVDSQVKIRGFRIELKEIEICLQRHPDVASTIVIARESENSLIIPSRKAAKGDFDKCLQAYVVPHQNMITQTHNEQSKQNKVSRWQSVFNQVYQQSDSLHDFNFNITGWNSSFTGKPIPAEEMKEWQQTTLNRIKNLKPRRLLEVGCGTGLLLFDLAPLCERYEATDFSQQALDHISQNQHHASVKHVVLHHRSAENFSGIASKAFDGVIVNSVVQYFPSIEYLVQVIAGAIKSLTPGGFIFLGDIRHLPLLPIFHTSVELSQTDSSVSCLQVYQNIKQRLVQEEELVIAPEFFKCLTNYFPEITQVEFQLKRGLYDNEMTQHRYDVILHLQKEKLTDTEIKPALKLLDWQINNLSIDSIGQLLSYTPLDRLEISNIPHEFLLKSVAAYQLLSQSDRPETMADLLNQLDSVERSGVNPEVIWKLAEQFNYTAHLSWSEHQAGSGCFDVLLCANKSNLNYSDNNHNHSHNRIEAPEEQKNFSNTAISNELTKYANTPCQAGINRNLVAQLKDYLKQQLPDYMQPASIICLHSIPLTLNGKIDLKSLPNPAHEMTLDFIPPQTATEQRLAEIWVKVMGLERVGLNDDFFNLGGHSLLATELIFHIRDTLNMEVPLQVLFQQPTLSGMAHAIDNLDKEDPTEIQLQKLDKLMQMDSILDPVIIPTNTYDPQQKISNILITGTTGFVGAFLLDQLLSSTNATIYCLVRAESQGCAENRLRHNMERYLVNSEGLTTRVIVVVGDLSKRFLGLEKTRFECLAKEIDVIYHNGAIVNFTYPYTSLRKTNVQGTEEILRLAAHIKTKRVHFISTLYVFSPDDLAARQQIIESDNPTHSQSLTLGYTQSKWVSEQLVKTANSRGIPTNIYRLGRVAGHSQTGACQTGDFLWRMIKSCIQIGCIPELNLIVDISPVDYLSSAIVRLSQQPHNSDTVFHLRNPRPPSLAEFTQQLCTIGYSLDYVSYSLWREKLISEINDNRDDAAYPLLSLFFGQPLKDFDRDAFSFSKFSCQQTLTMLPDSDMASLLLDERLLNTYFSYFKEVGFIDVPEARV
jgi:amino acid adenylation domain-containing protein/thioester reductase-like protein